MGIRGIENLTGGIMNEQPQESAPPESANAEATEGTPSQPTETTPAPPTPAHEEADKAAPQPDEDDQALEGDAEEPQAISEDVGNDDEATNPPAALPDESFEADPQDQHGAGDHPES